MNLRAWNPVYIQTHSEVNALIFWYNVQSLLHAMWHEQKRHKWIQNIIFSVTKWDFESNYWETLLCMRIYICLLSLTCTNNIPVKRGIHAQEEFPYNGFQAVKHKTFSKGKYNLNQPTGYILKIRFVKLQLHQYASRLNWLHRLNCNIIVNLLVHFG